jgi:hypothetical protein
MLSEKCKEIAWSRCRSGVTLRRRRLNQGSRIWKTETITNQNAGSRNKRPPWELASPGTPRALLKRISIGKMRIMKAKLPSQ